MMMTQNEITRVGNELIVSATQLIAENADIQGFYDNLEWESAARGGDRSMPLGWVAQRIFEVAQEAGRLISEELPPYHLPSAWQGR